MKKINFIVLFVIGLLSLSCFDDKGNYDYIKLNEISWDKRIADETADVGDKVIVKKPKLKFSLDSVDIQLGYEWKIDGELVSTDSVLEYIPEEIGTKACAFIVYDKRVGRKFYNRFSIKVQSRYKKGWLILAENNGVSELTLLRTEEKSGYWEGKNDTMIVKSIERDVYKTLTGSSLDGNPVKLHQYKAQDDFQGQLLVMQNGGKGSVELDNVTMERVMYLQDEFLDRDLPVNFEMKEAGFYPWNSYVLSNDGYLYSRKNEDNYEHFTAFFIKEPYLAGRKIQKLIPINIFTYRFFLLFSEDGNYLAIEEDSYSESTSGRSLVFQYDNKEFAEDFVNLEGEMVAAISQEGDKGTVVTTVFNRNGVYYIHDFSIKKENRKAIVTVSRSSLRPLGITNLSCTGGFKKYNEYIFFNGGDAQDKLYWHRPLTGETGLYYDFKGKKIMAIDCWEDWKPKPGPLVGVVTADGQFHLFEFDRLNLNSPKVTANTEWRVEGMPVDLLYKGDL
ncbi:PKD-like family lipoprotein [Gabonibacter massiliensis]|uniref:PKD-like family lipoprotein n=1 Tax=Gabonibacter massiliensis TaxID=1720195 RepID=UPI00073F5BBD|nr:PKD-like family lipoprotein [Gabonibacter massiliensis]